MSQAPTSAKICIKCQQDCSKRPRTKDAQGRYICQECLTKAQAAKAAAAPPPPTVEEEPLYALDDAALAQATAAAGKIEKPKACPNCGMVMGSGAVICTRCGLNTSTGKVLGTDKRAGAGKKCIKCGYSLEGLNAPVCPECGTINTKEDRKRAGDRAESNRIARNELIKPVIYFVIATAISVIVITTRSRISPSGALLGLGVLYAASVPLGLVIYFVCGLMWMGFDAPWRYTFLRMAAAVAIESAAFLALGFGFGLYRLGGLVVVMGYALYSLMDLELHDAMILSTIFVIAQFAVAIAIAMQGQ